MNEIDLIQDNIKALEESVKYYSPQKKEERELWVGNSFIASLNIQFEDDEIKTPEQDPPDVIFRDAEFEIKEILDPNRRRHEEYKKLLEKAYLIKKPDELLTQFRPVEKTITEIYQLCLEKTQSLVNKYAPSVIKSTDLLYYINLQNVMGLIETPFPDTTDLKKLGWRSVSFVMGLRSCVLTTNNNASSFLVSASHKISHRNYE